MQFKRGDKVMTGDGHEAKVIATDARRGLVAVKVEKPGTVGRNKGDEISYRESELRKR
jgi:preprotein translocase subunit YajC